VSIDYLDRRTPIAITSGSTFFDDIAEHWKGEAMTVFDLMKREAVGMARFAYQSGMARPQPTFYPVQRMSDTAPIPIITDVREDSFARLVDAWRSDPDTAERPVAMNLSEKRRRVPYKVRRAFWFVVDGVADIFGAIKDYLG
jgi:hypothetical protein